MSIELWPLGWALGNIVTKQMLAAVASTGGAWLQLESTVFVVVGLWIIINAVFWPILISKALVSGGTPAGNWILESISPVLSAGQGAVNVATTTGGGGGRAGGLGGGAGLGFQQREINKKFQGCFSRRENKKKE